MSATKQHTNRSDPALFGIDLFGEPIRPRVGPVAERFTVPPFTILDGRSGDWRDRRRAWISMGIDGEEGRSCKGSNSWHDKAGRSMDRGGQQKITAAGDGPTVFDPVLCEVAYRWFSPRGGQVVDPFAGGSVRGIVAAQLGRRYWGCDLRQEQIEANVRNAAEVGGSLAPEWICGDSMTTLEAAPEADMVFSCPPYGDLERYSDDPADLSAMEWHTFAAAYKRIVMRAVQRMKPDSFACFVVGDFRDKGGFYRNFVSTTIEAFETCGARLYNEAILATAIGSASLRAARQFTAGRKLVKVHQNVLVFCKGDWRKAVAKIEAAEASE